MNIGDRVKILAPQDNGGHCFEGRVGTITGFDDEPEFPWEVLVKVDDNQFGSVPFYKTELEVINE